MYELKIVFQQRLGFMLTVLGVALCAVLVLFLLGIYRGVERGSVAYVRSSGTDLWVMQRHADNILRSTSMVPLRSRSLLADVAGVDEVSPVLFLMASAQTPRGPATLYLTGFEPANGRGGPPRIVAGANVTRDGQIVLDQAFARKYRIALGEHLTINRETFEVVGYSAETNMFVIQYAFVSLAMAHRVLGIDGIATCFLVQLEPAVHAADVIGEIGSRLPDLAVYDQTTFLANNIREMESGLLPLLFVVAFISAVVLTAIESLILTVSVLERRKDFAIMKAIGSSSGFVLSLIVRQAVILACCGLIVAIVLFFPLVALVETLAPEVSTDTSVLHVVAVMVGVVAISLVSLILPHRRLRHIYPLEVFG